MTASFSFTHVTDRDLHRNAASVADRGRLNTAAIIAHLAEVERRKVHLAEGYASMLTYCVDYLRLSRDEAWKRIRVASISRRFPVILPALADGRLTLTTVLMLRRYLRRGAGLGLLKAALGLSKSEVEVLLAERFPTTGQLPIVDRIPAEVRSVAPEPLDPASAVGASRVAPEPLNAASGVVSNRVAPEPLSLTGDAESRVAPEPLDESAAPATITSAAASATRAIQPTVKPTAKHRYGMHFDVAESTYEKLTRAQAALSHKLPSADVAQVFDLALDALLAELDRKKYGATKQPRRTPLPTKPKSRHIPAHVRRAVRERDGDRCTYVSPSGHRCTAHRFLEFDHIQEFARGGEATVENIRLRCRPHNQYSAEQTYGAGFMEEKRRAGKEPPRAAATGGSGSAATPNRTTGMNRSNVPVTAVAEGRGCI